MRNGSKNDQTALWLSEVKAHYFPSRSKRAGFETENIFSDFGFGYRYLFFSAFDLNT